MAASNKTSNRKLLSVEPAKDSDGSNISVYKYEVEKNGKMSIQTVKTRKNPKYKDNKYIPEQHKSQVITELLNYFSNYKFESQNQLEEFRLLTKSNDKLKHIVDHIFNKLQVKITQLQLKQLIATEISNKITVKISFI